ncbi:hypothetical protein AKG11_03645 [Shinella sp. SUS2]|nr:hypothetical protein AKG11_03645 [Shinella sp. SUS2]KOC77432.1 hypothetical protein AKG10_01115 [Shinella sp. GWS1]
MRERLCPPLDAILKAEPIEFTRPASETRLELVSVRLMSMVILEDDDRELPFAAAALLTANMPTAEFDKLRDGDVLTVVKLSDGVGLFAMIRYVAILLANRVPLAVIAISAVVPVGTAA